MRRTLLAVLLVACAFLSVPARSAEIQKSIRLERANLLRGALGRPSLTEHDWSSLEALDAAAPTAAYLEAATAFLDRIERPEGSGEVLTRLASVGIAPKELGRLELMARSITRSLGSSERRSVSRMVETFAQRASERQLHELAARLQGVMEDSKALQQDRVQDVLDRFFTQSVAQAAGEKDPVVVDVKQRDAPKPPALKTLKSEPSAEPAVESAAKRETSEGMERRKIIAKLKNLHEQDPTSAYIEAGLVLINPNEKRLEVQLAALRVIEKGPAVKAAPMLTKLLNFSPSWYLQREAARALGEIADSLSADGWARQSAIESLRKVAKLDRSFLNDDEFALVMMARKSYRRFGLDPGPEPKVAPLQPKKVLGRLVRFKKVAHLAWLRVRPWVGKAIFLLAVTWGLGLVWMFLMSLKNPAYGAALASYLAVGSGIIFGIALIWGASWLSNKWSASSKGASIERPTTKFDEVVGIDDALIEIKEIVDFLKNPEKYRGLVKHPPKGVLMVGPPGTGKTLMARALAGETQVPFFSVSGSEFVEMFVGVGAARVRDLFKQAKANAPAIIFIDEFETLGRKRSSGHSDGGTQEHEQTLNQLLKLMDGFDNSSGVIVIAATNREELIDDAAKRPGRFDRTVHVGLPDVLGRENILQLHARTVRLGADVDLRPIARRTFGLSGAFLENIINEAGTMAARRGSKFIEMQDLYEAADRQSMGGKRNYSMSDDEKQLTAYHEGGHALVNILTGGTSDTLTIIPRGNSMGHHRMGSEENEEDRHGYSKSELKRRMAVSFGGLVAEELIKNEHSTGPSGDLHSVSRIAREMVLRLGMGPKAGWETFQDDRELLAKSEAKRRAIDADIETLSQQSYDEAIELILNNEEALHALAQALLKDETLVGEDVRDIVLKHAKTKPRKKAA